MSGRMSSLDSKEKLRCNVRYLHRGAHVSSAQVHTSSPELTRRQHGGIGKPHPIVLSCRRFLPCPPPGRGPASSPWRRFPPRLLDTRPAPSLRRPAGFAHVALFAPGVASRSTDVLRFTCVCLGHGHLGGFSFRGAMSTAAMNMPFAEHPPAYMGLPRRGTPGPHAHAWLGWASLPALIN